MSKFVQAFLSGVFFTFLLDFLIFLSIQQNYINVYEINVYYNILFADHQNIYIYMAFTALIGYIVVYLNNKTGLIALSSLFILTSLTLIQPIGNFIGKEMLMEKNVTLQNNKHTFVGDIYYDGRKQITFYDYELKKMIILNKKELK